MEIMDPNGENQQTFSGGAANSAAAVSGSTSGTHKSSTVSGRRR